MCFISSNHHQSNFRFSTKPPFVPRGNNTRLVLPRHPRQSPNPFTYTIHRLDVCVVLSTTTSFFLWVSPRSEYGCFSRDEKGGSGWPVDRRGHARIGSQGYQSTEDKQHQQRRWRQRLRDDQEVQARHIQCEMGRLWKHKSQRRYHVHVCRGDRLLRRAGSRETDRYTLEGPNHHANRVDGRGWASGAYFGALAIVMVVGGICECSLQYFHALNGFQSNRSVAKVDPGCKGNRIFATFLATSR